MRVAQRAGKCGSQLWIQRAVGERWPALEGPVVAALGEAASELEWLSPLADDDHAEYRDAAFLDRLGLDHLAPALAAFWPPRGPQWDALGRSTAGQVILVEAKSHIAEFCSPATAARGTSRARITDRLREVATALGAKHGTRWSEQFYQHANRLAHLLFLRDAGIEA